MAIAIFGLLKKQKYLCSVKKMSEIEKIEKLNISQLNK